MWWKSVRVGTSRRTSSTTSWTVDGSMPLLIVTAAVVCGTTTMADATLDAALLDDGPDLVGDVGQRVAQPRGDRHCLIHPLPPGA